MDFVWYARRLSRMSPLEVQMRLRDAGVIATWWAKRAAGRNSTKRLPEGISPDRPVALLEKARSAVAPEARERLLAAADSLLEGRWRVFDLGLDDFGEDWDWFLDPQTGRRAPATRFAPAIDHRDEMVVGNVKYLWELSRHHHLTALAAAWFLSRDDRYAERVSAHLRAWWRFNPFLTGIHWSSGIEVGLRLVAWTWIRRLLEGWTGATELFDENPLFYRQVFDHQRFLAGLRSHGSSANNHLIAELAGLFVSTCAFPVYPDADRWRRLAARGLRKEIRRQNFPDGVNRELATDYHGFVLELALTAALEGEAAGHPLGAETWTVLRSMMDALAAMLDSHNRPPRQGDSDDGHGLLLDPPGYDRWSDLLDTGARLFEPLAWWPPPSSESVRAPLWSSLAAPPSLPSTRPENRRSLFPEAGFVILRGGNAEEEIWCRCDHGSLGYLSTAAHAHADALSIELRVGGIEVLVDPGTYCYHGEPVWRRYFRSTLAHNTLELDGCDQSESGGPFLWMRHARSWLIEASGLDSGHVAVWHAAHDGYDCLDPPAIHERRVEFDREARTITIRDQVLSNGSHECRLSFHLGPKIHVQLGISIAELNYMQSGTDRRFFFELPNKLEWSVAQGETDPPLGWYSARFGSKQPSNSLIGSGSIEPRQDLVTRLEL